MSTKIEWTEDTWNPVTGCTKISEGCLNCYAEKMANRLYNMGVENYKNKFEVTIHEHMINEPKKIKKPKMIFVNSMSDLFHEDIPIDFIKRIFNTMNRCPQHTFQVLTKRSENMLKIIEQVTLTKNIWLGVTIENNRVLYRMNDLLKVKAHVKFISFEPLLENINNIDLTGIDWAIVGGESGPNARAIEENWILNIKEACKKSKTAFFFKQWGGVNKKKNGRILQGRTWNAIPHYAL